MAPSARVRIAAFAPFLRPHGVELEHRPTLTDGEYATLSSGASALRKSAIVAGAATRAVLGRRPDHELLLVHRLRLLSPLPLADPPRRLDVYDIDDALFLGSTAEVNRRFEWAKREAQRSVEYARRARLVLAGNSYLADWARRHAPRVEVVPSCVDPSTQALREHADAETAVVGWIGSRTTSAYLMPVLPVFAALNEDRVRARLVLIGADPSLRAPWIEHRPWSLATQGRDLASLDVGIMPLPDTDWARGKCGYKLLQYFAAGVPAVASPVGVNRELVGDERGVLAGSPGEWRAGLERLLADVAERREQGAAARAFVERRYSYQTWAPELAAMLRSAN
jgi:glycosyltransferase involved in cell wall biosynthesis